MPTLILTSRYTDDSQALWRAATSQGWNVVRLVKWRLPEEVKPISEPVLYLEALMAGAIAQELRRRLLEIPIDWLPNLPEAYRKRWIYLSTLGEARNLGQAAFIKPPNDKSFSASVYDPGNLPSEYDDETPVLIAEVVEWEKEFRCFILNRKLHTFSVYLRDGELQSESGFIHTSEEEVEVLDFIERLLADEQVEVPAATVIDIGVIRCRGWAVIEQNAAWGAGLYGCDPAKVLEVLRLATIPAEQFACTSPAEYDGEKQS